MRWLPVVAWSAVILAASSDVFSADRTGAALYTLFGREIPYALHVALRKLSHLLGYGILGLLAFRASVVDFRRPVLASHAVVLVVAVLDEWHQTTTLSRSGSLWDVLLDVVGGALAIAFLRARMAAANSTKESP